RKHEVNMKNPPRTRNATPGASAAAWLRPVEVSSPVEHGRARPEADAAAAGEHGVLSGHAARRRKSMKKRLRVEQLEDRLVPTVTASLVNGVLVVRGPADGAVVITETAADTFQVTDNGNTVGTVSGASGVVILARDRATPVNDNVTVNLNGHAVDFIF